MNDPFDLLQDNKSYIIGDIKRNRDVNILLQVFTLKKMNRKCLPLTKYTENTGPEMIFSRFNFFFKNMKSAKIRATIPSNKTSIWCGLNVSFLVIT
jgi:hypothetical protein